VSTTYGELKTRILASLQDPDGRTFTAPLVTELVEAALAEVGLIAPEQFQEDLTPVENQIVYPLRSDEFGAEVVQEIEVSRVEVWDGSTTPETFISAISSAAQQPEAGMDGGWYTWNGSLYLPTRAVRGLVGYELDYLIKVWGYSPYATPSDDDDVMAVTKQVENAMVAYSRLTAIDMLLSSRDLFTQWQARSGNTDTTLAGMVNQRSVAEQAWMRRAHAIGRLRSRV
jgi:hypothetical protein